MSPCSVPVLQDPRELVSSTLTVGCRLVSPVHFLRQVCCHIVRLHLHPVARWIETRSTFDLANVLALGFEKNPSDFILSEFPFLIAGLLVLETAEPVRPSAL